MAGIVLWTAARSKVSPAFTFCCLEFEQSAKMTWFDFISSIGGVLPWNQLRLCH